MGWPLEPLVIPTELRDIILTEKCVVFLGSGASAECYDDWATLINGLCECCGSERRVDRYSETDAFLDAAEDAKRRNREAYFRYLGQRLGQSANLTQLLYQSVLELPFKCYMTVNFDPLLAMTGRSFRCPPNPRLYPNLDRLHVRDRNIFYLHGLIREGSVPRNGEIVLSKSEFDEAYAPNQPLRRCLGETFENDPVLFLGCRLQEPVMPKLFQECKENQQRRIKMAMERGITEALPPRRFIFLPRPTIGTDGGTDGGFDAVASEKLLQLQAQYYRAMEIEPLWYTAVGSDHSALRKALDDLAGLPSIEPVFHW